MKMYHPDSNYPIDVHPTRVESMQAKGWTFDEPTKAKPKRKAKDAIETTQEIDNGES
jgi:hypothetical protein